VVSTHACSADSPGDGQEKYMDRKLVEVEVPEGTRLGFAQDSDGAMRGLLFDRETNKLVGHAKLFDHEAEHSDYYTHHDDDDDGDDEFDELARVIADALVFLTIRGIEAAAPHVKSWWKEKAAPALKSAPSRVRTRLRRSSSTDESNESTTVELVVPEPATHQSTGAGRNHIQKCGPAMSSAEAEERLAFAVAAMAFAREQMMILQNARIVDENDPFELASAFKELTPEGVEHAVQLMLEANPSLLRGQDLIALKVALGDGFASDLESSDLSLPQTAPTGNDETP